MKNENGATLPPASDAQPPALPDAASAANLDDEDFELPQPQHCDMDICESCQ